ncbi:ComF family protein [Patescibacteria group bacterium]|nr:ComF family protein [Patescibacteria group bacterium]
MLSFIRIIYEFFLDLLFPPFCLGCGHLGNYLCSKCYASIYFYPFPPNLNLEPNYLDKLIVLSHYDSPLKELIIAYKYRKGKILAKTLSDLVWQSVIIKPTSLVTFIPLHPQKEKLRGFNQTKLLAENLAEKLEIKCQNTLIKTKHHLAQAATTSRAERLTNVVNTFTLDPKFAEFVKTKPPPSSVLIVDDVITTGSTLNEAARILKSIGVKNVYGFALAHD